MLLREHRASIYADFRRFYGMGLDEAPGVCTLREFCAMVAHLPEESATMRAVNPDWRWGLIEHLLAALLDETRAGWWLYERVTTKSKRRPPKPVERPGVRSDDGGSQTYGKGSAMTLEEAAAWLGWDKPGGGAHAST